MDYDASLFDESIFADSVITDWPFDDREFSDPSYLNCVLAAGDSRDLPNIREWCDALPEDAYGRVFIEVFSPMQIQQLATPQGVGVTWICRERLRECNGSGDDAPRCQALMTAVDAWLDEWYRSEYGPERSFSMWMGARSNTIMSEYWTGVEAEVAEASSRRG